MTPAANDHKEPEKSLLLVSPEYEGVTSSWFSPSFWGGQAKPVASGGRGGAWFINTEPDHLVLRHYRRGGLMARLTEKTYLFSSFEQSRSLAEFRLLVRLRSLGLPVPEPVAAIAWKYRVFWYQAAILVKRIPGAVTFADSPSLDSAELWRQLGRVIRQFHDLGLNHVDLNCDNVLVTDDQIYLIDFDRCRLVAGGIEDANAAWKQGNLKRLYRSIEKRCTRLPPEQRQTLWDMLLQAYSHPQR